MQLIEIVVLGTREDEDVELEQETPFDFSRHGAYIGIRIYTVRSIVGNRCYLQILLLTVGGAKCYEDICTVDGKLWALFRKKCNKQGLLADGELWKRTLREYFYSSFVSFSGMFAIFFAIRCSLDPFMLWTKHGTSSGSNICSCHRGA